MKALASEPDAIHFLNEAYKHCKPIACDEASRKLLEATYFFKGVNDDTTDKGLIVQSNLKKLSKEFIAAIAQHRFWEREKRRRVPA